MLKALKRRIETRRLMQLQLLMTPNTPPFPPRN